MSNHFFFDNESESSDGFQRDVPNSQDDYSSTMPPRDPTTAHFILQLVMASIFVISFCIMICMSLWARCRPQQIEPAPTTTSEVSEKERQKYVSSVLVVKHVIRDCAAKTTRKCTTTSADHDIDHDADDDNSTVQSVKSPVPTYQKSLNQELQDRHHNEPSTTFTICYHRLKSNLILSDPDNEDADRDSKREPWMCAICLSGFDIGDEICWSQNPNCSHAFHYECMQSWLQKHDECPCCRNNYLQRSGSVIMGDLEEGFRSGDDLSPVDPPPTSSIDQSVMIAPSDQTT